MKYVILEKAKTKTKVPIHLKTGKMTMGYRFKGRSQKPQEQRTTSTSNVLQFFKGEDFNKIDLKEYKKLNEKSKEKVLSYSIENYEEKYVVKQIQGKLAKNPTFKYLNGQLGMLEGKRRWALGESEDYPKYSSDHRKWLHMAVAYQSQADAVAQANHKWFGGTK